ncbi:G-protein coupled receptor Mth2-like isoform X3 [Pieris brassicae]|uniref:G-protein coupled receptor Mth2-like isoform X3 n=1 Tax=Pieris brassicae TaxID=7116 RepID=UPI001E65F6C1|nr:G-protein coupled receptor Mth2-like isoform X3 [Pieris brassicae]
MFIFLLINLFCVINVRGQLCSADYRMNLTGLDVFSDGSIVKNGIRFPPNEIFSLNVSGDFETFGCPCELRNCFRKCCPLGQVMVNRSCVEMYDVLQKELRLHYYDNHIASVDLEKSDQFAVLTGIPCDWNVYKEDDGPWYVQLDGKLYVEIPTSVKPWTVFTPDMYCIDSFVSEEDGKQISRLDALVCFDPQPDEENYIPGIICMLISCVFIIVTVAVYYCLPELCNLHGKVLIAYLLSLFVGFIFLSTMQILLSIDNISREYCMTFTFIIYYFILAAFFWLNVMSFDIWWTFSGNRGISIERMSVKSRFRAYTIYAFGVPAMFTGLVAGLEFSHLPLNWYLPLLRQQGCFISGKSKLIYLYGPMVILCVANLVFFILTALKIREIKEQTAVLKSRESATHDKHNKDKQRLLLYVKLFIVMGINWVLEVISALYPKANSIWKFTDAYNVLVGLIIFILFVCKKKIFRLLKNRYRQVRGRSMNRSQTTTSRTVSTKEDMALAALTKH